MKLFIRFSRTEGIAKAIHLLYFIENRTNDSDYQDSIFKAELKSQSKLRISAYILGEKESKARVKSTHKPSNTLNTNLSATTSLCK